MNVFFYFLLFSSIVFSQTHVLSGLVLDETTKEPLPSATIRVVGTSKGTVTNGAGQFRFALPAGKIRIAASYVGYQSDTITMDLDTNRFRAIMLQPNEIQLSGVTVTDEDPAYEIIRRAIESKKKWMTQLRTFEGKAFNRLQLRTDSSIAAITEAYSILYWTNGDSLREVITQQKQTGNLPSSFQSSRVGNVLNFNDDNLKLSGYTFVGPTAPDAFEYYGYKLLSTRKMDDFDVFEIELIPRSKLKPLFKGTISIAERSYAVMNVDVRPNEAMSQLFVDTRESRYTQSFRLFEEKFWLPANYRFSGNFKISVMGLTFPAFGIERDVVIYDYAINPEFADTIKRLNKLTVDSSVTRFDSTFWSANDVLPLTAEQDSAYRTLDSTQTLDKKFAPKGAGAALLELTGSSAGFFDIWFNRVEGLHLGASKSFSNVVENIDLRGGFGYGLSDKKWKYEAGATIHFGEERSSSSSSGFANVRIGRKTFSLSADVYDKQVYFPEPLIPGLLLNSFAALFEKDDVFDYYRVIGGAAALTYVMNGTTRFTGSIMTERHLSLHQSTNYSFFRKNSLYAFQPPINDGRMNGVKLNVVHGSSGLFGLEKDAYTFSGSAEHSASFLGGNFDFTKISGKFRAKIASANKEELVFPPTFGMQIAGGTSFGNLPAQRYFELYSKFETFSGYGALKGLQRRQFYGDRYIAVTVDHNFRRILFAPLGIQWLMESNLEVIVEGNIARSWFSGKELRPQFFPANNSRGWYSEASIGVSNVFDVLRIDLTRRFSKPDDWVVTLGVSDFLMSLITQ